jgi:Ca-activated chloride channel family protein
MDRRLAALIAALALTIAACGATPAASPTASPSPTPAPATPSPSPSAPPSVTPAPTGGPATVSAPAQLEAGAEFEVTWTGPALDGDYVTIVKAGATKWTNEQYFYTQNTPSPGTLTAPIAAGAYEIWYVNGADETINARQAVTVGDIAATVTGPTEVVANTRFNASWTGPDGNGDYVTIVKAGATRWTNEPYFYTQNNPTGELLAPLTAGAYELWYVTGADQLPKAKQPIAVTALSVTLTAPDKVAPGAAFEVSWTGPDGPGDYVTIVRAGATKWTNEPYFYTNNQPTGPLTAPDQAGAYEIWYVTGQSPDPVGRRAISVGS